MQHTWSSTWILALHYPWYVWTSLAPTSIISSSLHPVQKDQANTIRKVCRWFQNLFEKKLAHMDPLEFFFVIQVNFCIVINRVNTIEDNGKRGARPDKGNEKGNVQTIFLDVNVHVDRDNLQAQIVDSYFYFCVFLPDRCNNKQINRQACSKGCSTKYKMETILNHCQLSIIALLVKAH